MTVKRCSLCEIRPVGSGSNGDQRHARTMGYCTPCLTQAEWENQHSDDDHEGVLSGHLQWGMTTHENRAEFDAWMKDRRAETERCWICHPELDESKSTTTRTGTSRVGMRLTVPLRAPGRTKAETLVKTIDGKAATSIQVRKGITTLKAATKLGTGFVLRWDEEGRYDYASSVATVDGKKVKVRNASAALRLLGL